MDHDPAAQTSPAIGLDVSSASIPSMNGYGATGQDDIDVLVLIGAAFAGGLLLAALVSRLGS